MSDYTFTEQTSFEAGFAKVFDRQIAPRLDEAEAERVRVNRVYKNVLIISCGVVLGLAAYLAVVIHWAAGLFVLFWGGCGLFLFMAGRGKKLEGQLSSFVIPLITEFLGNTEHHEKPARGFLPVDDLEGLKLIPKGGKGAVRDGIEGTWRDVPFRIGHLWLTKNENHHGKRRRVGVFKGLVIAVKCPVDMPSILFHASQSSFTDTLNRMLMSNFAGMNKFTLDDAEAEAAFEVYASDPGRAREMLPADFGRRLLAIVEEHGGDPRAVSAAFDGNVFHLALRRGGAFLDFSVMDAPLTEFDRKIHQAFNDLTLPRRLIDKLIDPAS